MHKGGLKPYSFHFSICPHLHWNLFSRRHGICVNGVSIQQTRYVEPMLVQCWAGIGDAGSTLSQHWLDISCLAVRTWDTFNQSSSQESQFDPMLIWFYRRCTNIQLPSGQCCGIHLPRDSPQHWGGASRDSGGGGDRLSGLTYHQATHPSWSWYSVTCRVWITLRDTQVPVLLTPWSAANNTLPHFLVKIHTKICIALDRISVMVT